MQDSLWVANGEEEDDEDDEEEGEAAGQAAEEETEVPDTLALLLQSMQVPPLLRCVCPSRLLFDFAAPAWHPPRQRWPTDSPNSQGFFLMNPVAGEANPP